MPIELTTVPQFVCAFPGYAIAARCRSLVLRAGLRPRRTGRHRPALHRPAARRKVMHAVSWPLALRASTFSPRTSRLVVIRRSCAPNAVGSSRVAGRIGVRFAQIYYERYRCLGVPSCSSFALRTSNVSAPPPRVLCSCASFHSSSAPVALRPRDGIVVCSP